MVCLGLWDLQGRPKVSPGPVLMCWDVMGTAAVTRVQLAETVVVAAAVVASSAVWTAALVSWLAGVHVCSQSLAQDSPAVNLQVDQQVVSSLGNSETKNKKKKYFCFNFLSFQDE